MSEAAGGNDVSGGQSSSSVVHVLHKGSTRSLRTVFSAMTGDRSASMGTAIRRDTLKKIQISSAVIANENKSIFARMVVSPMFESATLLAITANCIWMGLDVDWHPDARPGSPFPRHFFDVGESIFCFFFLYEITARILSYPRKREFFTDAPHCYWNIFDLILTGNMLLDVWVLSLLPSASDWQQQIFGALRMGRILRLTRIFKFVPELAMMVKSMAAAMRSCASTSILAFGVMYVFSILLATWTKSYGSQGRCIAIQDGGHPLQEPCVDPTVMECLCLQDYFASIPGSFLTLTQMSVFDDTFSVIRPVLHERGAYGCLLVMYLLLVSFTIMNMLVGIICDIIKETHDREKAKLQKTIVGEIFKYLDTDGSGTITAEEFEGGILSLVQCLEREGFAPDTLSSAFEMMDVDHDGRLGLQEFLHMIFRLNGADILAMDVLSVLAQIEKLADMVGVGRHVVAILAKEKGKGDGDRGDGSKSLKSSRSVEDLSKAQPNGLVEEQQELMVRRMDILRRRLEDLHLLADATGVGAEGGAALFKSGDGPCKGQPNNLSAPSPGKLGPFSEQSLPKYYNLQDPEVHPVQSQQFRLPSQTLRGPRQTLRRRQLAALGTSVRALGSQLHSLKAECKAYSAPRYQSLTAAKLPPTMAVFDGVGTFASPRGGSNAAVAAWQLEEAVSEAIASAAEVRTLLLGAPPVPSATPSQRLQVSASPAASLPLPLQPPPLIPPASHSRAMGAGGGAATAAGAAAQVAPLPQLSLPVQEAAEAPPATPPCVLPMSPGRRQSQLTPAAARATAAAEAAAAVAASAAATVAPRSAPSAAVAPLTPRSGDNIVAGNDDGGGDTSPHRRGSSGPSSEVSHAFVAI